MLGGQGPKVLQPGPHRPFLEAGEGGPDPPATGMPSDNDMPDLQVQDGVFQDGLHVGIVEGNLVGYVSVNEQLAGLGADHAVHTFSAVGTAEEEEGRPLALGQLREVVRVFRDFGLHPGSVSLQQSGEVGHISNLARVLMGC